MPRTTGKSNQPGAVDALRAEATADLDRLLKSAAELRTQLRVFETGLRRARRHLAAGGEVNDMRDVLDVVAARETLTVAAADFQADRHVSRVSVFRLQRAEGMSLGAIARAWGLSRQLVSRMLKEDGRGR